jgi:flagellar hook-associated protein 2
MSSSISSILSDVTSTKATSTVDVSSILAAVSGKSTTAIDVSSAVQAAVYAAQAPERIWEADQTTLTSETTALTAIQTATTALQSDMQSLNSLTGPLSKRTVTSSDTSEITATATNGTVAGSHTVVVNNIASTAAWYSELEKDSTTTLADSSFVLTTGSGTSAVSTTFSTNGDTLTTLAAAINKKELGVTATVVSDSTGSRLAILSTSSGTSADFSISTAYTSWTAPEMTKGEALAAGTIKLTGATSTAGSANITITAGESYADLATAINAATDSNGNSLGLTATATTDSSTGATNLTITSTDKTTAFTIDQPSATPGSVGYTQAVAGEDASLTVDGIPIESASNNVTGAINGVTLTLLSASPTTAVNLTVASDASTVSTAINQFVTDYNTAMGLLSTQFKVSSATDSSNNTASSEGVLASDPLVRALQSSLQTALSYTYTPTSGTTTIASLYDLGITVGNDGTLTVDSTTLDNALANNATDVQNFFEGTALNGFAASLDSTLDAYTTYSTGAFTVDLSSISTESSDLTTQISNFETNYISPKETLLTAMYTKAEAALESLDTTMSQINALLTNTSSS